MKTISSALQAHVEGEVTTLATCWKITRQDGEVMGFTEHDRDVTVSGVTYKAATGFTPSAIAQSAALNVDNLEVEGMLDGAAITEEALTAGLYDFAEIEIFQVNYAAPDAGRIRLRRGWLGEISIRNGRFVAEVRGLAQKLAQQIGALYSPACRAELGDGRCKVNLVPHTKNGSITAVSGRHALTDSGRTESSAYFTGGKITFTSGANAGIAMEIKEYAQGHFVLALPMPYSLAVGDGYTAQAGCDKNFATCASRFANAVNFRGEPHVPGLDRMLETAATRSR